MPTATPTATQSANTAPSPATLRAKKMARQKFDSNRFFIIQDKTVRFCPGLAREIGERESYLLLQLEYWMATTQEEHDGRRCFHTSLKHLREFFDWWSHGTAFRTLKSLRDKELIETMPSPRGRHDGQLIFFRFDKIARLKSIRVGNYEAPPPVEDDEAPADATAQEEDFFDGDWLPEDAADGSLEDHAAPVYQSGTAPKKPVQPGTHSVQDGTQPVQDGQSAYQGGLQLVQDGQGAYKVRGRDRVGEEKEEKTTTEAALEEKPRRVTKRESMRASIVVDYDPFSEDYVPELVTVPQPQPQPEPELTRIRPDGSVFIAQEDIATGDDLRQLYKLPADRFISRRDREELAKAAEFVQEERLRLVDVQEFIKRATEKHGEPPRCISRMAQCFHAYLPNFEQQRRSHVRAIMEGRGESVEPAPPIAPAAPLIARPAPQLAPQVTHQLPTQQPAAAQERPHAARGASALARVAPSDKWNATAPRAHACGLVLRALPEAARTAILEAGVAQLSPFLRDGFKRAVANGTTPGYSVQRAIEEYAADRVWQDHRARVEGLEATIEAGLEERPSPLPALQLPGAPAPGEEEVAPVAVAPTQAQASGWSSVGDVARGAARGLTRAMLSGIPVPDHITG